MNSSVFLKSSMTAISLCAATVAFGQPASSQRDQSMPMPMPMQQPNSMLAGSVQRGDTQHSGMQHDGMAHDSMSYVAMAGAADMFEMESARIAMQQTRTPMTRRFAQMLRQHHRMTTQATMAASRSAHLRPMMARMSPEQQRMIAELRRARGADFDRMFWSQQVMAHEQALALHQGYARSGDSAPLRRSAESAVPVVTRHLETARMSAR